MLGRKEKKNSLSHLYKIASMENRPENTWNTHTYYLSLWPGSVISKSCDNHLAIPGVPHSETSFFCLCSCHVAEDPNHCHRLLSRFHLQLFDWLVLSFGIYMNFYSTFPLFFWKKNVNIKKITETTIWEMQTYHP